MTHSWAQGSATSPWSFILSALKQTLGAVSSMQVRRCCSASGEAGRTVLVHEGGVEIVDLLGALGVGEQRVGKYEGAAVYDEADLEPEKAAQPAGEVGERLSSLRVSGTLFASFRVGTMGAGGGTCCYSRSIAVAYSTRTGTDMGTCTMDTMRGGIACHAVRVRIGGRCRVPFWFWELGG